MLLLIIGFSVEDSQRRQWDCFLSNRRTGAAPFFPAFPLFFIGAKRRRKQCGAKLPQQSDTTSFVQVSGERCRSQSAEERPVGAADGPLIRRSAPLGAPMGRVRAIDNPTWRRGCFLTTGDIREILRDATMATSCWGAGSSFLSFFISSRFRYNNK